MSRESEIAAFLDRVREAIALGFYEFSRKALRELAAMQRDEDWGLAVLMALDPSDWHRDESPWDRSFGVVRVFCPPMDVEVDLWIRLREEDGGFIIIISFHPMGAS